MQVRFGAAVSSVEIFAKVGITHVELPFNVYIFDVIK